MKKEIIRIFLYMILLLVLISIPSVNSRTIEYPKEEGPYTVYIGGFVYAFSSNSQIDFYSQISPFWKLNDTQKINYNFNKMSIFYVDSSLQNIKYPASIHLWGFNGFAPTYWMLNFKLFYPRFRVFGQCDRIVIYDDLG